MSNPYFGPNLIPGIMIWTKLNIIDLIEKKPPGQKSGNVCGSILKQEPSQPKDLKIGLYLFSSFCLFGFFFVVAFLQTLNVFPTLSTFRYDATYLRYIKPVFLYREPV